MRKKRKIQRWSNLYLASIVGISFLSPVLNAGVSQSDEQDVSAIPTWLAQSVEELRKDLGEQSVQTEMGKMELFEISDCQYAIEKLGNCLGNNPVAPYIVPTVPHWPDEFVDSSMSGILGPLDKGLSWTHRMGEKEALVIMGQLPPSARYFGVQPYVFSRAQEQNLEDPIYQSLTDEFMKSILFMHSPNPERPLVFSSMGDSVNNVVIQNQSGQAFDSKRYFIITSDHTLSEKIKASLLNAGAADESHIFTIPVARDFARLGLSKDADDFLTIVRYALPDDEELGDKWRQDIPLAVLRVRDLDELSEVTPYAITPRDVRTANSEMSLTMNVDRLVTAIKDRFSQEDAAVDAFESLQLAVDLLGNHCIARPMNCLGDSSDADYQMSQTVSFGDDTVIGVAGTLGTKTLNASYSSLSLNLIPELKGVLSISDTKLEGTATYFSSTVENTDQLYVYYFARHCTGITNCVEVSEEMVPFGAKVKVIQRNYVVPGSTRGPDPMKLVSPRLILMKTYQGQ